MLNGSAAVLFQVLSLVSWNTLLGLHPLCGARVNDLWYTEFLKIKKKPLIFSVIITSCQYASWPLEQIVLQFIFITTPMTHHLPNSITVANTCGTCMRCYQYRNYVQVSVIYGQTPAHTNDTHRSVKHTNMYRWGKTSDISENIHEVMWLVSVGRLAVRCVVKWSCFGTTKTHPADNCNEDETIDHLLIHCSRSAEKIKT